ncbi:MAG: hypothetical protein V8T87_06360 [Victivallales bacterium]
MNQVLATERIGPLRRGDFVLCTTSLRGWTAADAKHLHHAFLGRRQTWLPGMFLFLQSAGVRRKNNKRKKIKFSPIRPVRLIPKLYLKHHIVELSNFLGKSCFPPLTKAENCL